MDLASLARTSLAASRDRAPAQSAPPVRRPARRVPAAPAAELTETQRDLLRALLGALPAPRQAAPPMTALARAELYLTEHQRAYRAASRVDTARKPRRPRRQRTQTFTASDARAAAMTATPSACSAAPVTPVPAVDLSAAAQARAIAIDLALHRARVRQPVRVPQPVITSQRDLCTCPMGRECTRHRHLRQQLA